MGASKTTYWVIGAALVALAMLGGGWVLLVQPQLAAANDTRSETAAVEEQNRVQQEQVDALRVQFDNIETYKAELESLQEQMPPDDGTVEFLEAVGALAEQNGLVVTATTTAGGEPVVPLETAEAPAQPPADDSVVEAADDAAEATDEQTEATEPAGTAPAPADPVTGAIEGLVSIPVSVSVLGPAESARAFADALQSGLPRLLLVEILTTVAQPEADAAEGRPATVLGDVELTISGYLFVFRDVTPEAPEPGTDESAEPAPLPQPSGVNPFAPNARDS